MKDDGRGTVGLLEECFIVEDPPNDDCDTADELCDMDLEDDSELLIAVDLIGLEETPSEEPLVIDVLSPLPDDVSTVLDNLLELDIGVCEFGWCPVDSLDPFSQPELDIPVALEEKTPEEMGSTKDLETDSTLGESITTVASVAPRLNGTVDVAM